MYDTMSGGALFFFSCLLFLFLLLQSIPWSLVVRSTLHGSSSFFLVHMFITISSFRLFCISWVTASIAGGNTISFEESRLWVKVREGEKLSEVTMHLLSFVLSFASW